MTAPMAPSLPHALLHALQVPAELAHRSPLMQIAHIPAGSGGMLRRMDNLNAPDPSLSHTHAHTHTHNDHT